MTTAHRPFWYLGRRPADLQSEIDEELRLHLDMRTEELVARGMAVEDARREALRQFGDLPGTREYCRRQDEDKEHRMQRAVWIEDLLQDLRIGLRGLLRAPMTTLTLGGPLAVILSRTFWQQHLGGRADRIGKPIQLDGAGYTVVGVLPEAVGPLERGQDLFVPVQFVTPPRKGPFFLTVVARLKRDGSRATAVEELHAINRRIFPLWRASYQDDKATWGMVDLQSYVIGDVRAIATLALFAVALVLQIAWP